MTTKSKYYLNVKFALLLIFALCLQLNVLSQTPSSVLPDLQYFKLTFPLDEDGDDNAGVDYEDRNDPLIKAWERDNLNNWNPPSPYSNYFFVSGNEVVFRSHCAGALTSANSYPRCELRETPNGTDDLWEFSDEHELNATFRVTNLPNEKEEVCMLQIKGNDSNSTSGTEEAFRLEYRADGSQGVHVTINENTTLTDIMDYSVGQTIEARMYVNNGEITIQLNNTSVSGSNGQWNYDYDSDYSHGYFKAGAYTQSSIWEEKNGVGDENNNAYGEVRFSELVLGESDGINNPPIGCSVSTPGNRRVNSVGESSAVLAWNSVSNVDHYDIRYRKTQDTDWKYKTNLENNVYTLTGLNNDQEYEWQVRAKCSSEDGSSYSSGQGPDFTTGSGGNNPGGSDNLALGKNTSQSSTAHGGSSGRAVDGNTNGNWNTGTITHTNAGVGQWWQVDLGATYDIDEIEVWNRTNCCSNRLRNFTVEVRNSSGSVVWSGTSTSAPSPSKSINANGSGRYVRIVQNVNEALSLAEVRVYGEGNSGGENNIVMITKRNAPNFAVDGKGGSSNGQNVHLWGTNPNNSNQKWIEIPVGNGYYMYQKLNTEHCLDGKGGGSNGQNVHLWGCNPGNQNQHWLKQSTSGGAFKLIKRSGGQSFALNGGSNGTNGQNVNIYDASNGSYNLQWFITTVGQAKLAQMSNLGDVIIYPNPIESLVTIEGAEDAILNIYDVNGKFMMTADIEGYKQELDLSSLNKGIYFAYIIKEQSTSVIKIVK